jgi:hypothetical protein
MPATRSMAAADSTELPPNFMTIISEHSFRMHELGIQYGRAGGSANGVVAQGDELVIQHRAGAQTAHEGRHAALALGIFARLRAVGLFHINDGLRRRAGKLALLRHGGEVIEGVAHVGERGLRENSTETVTVWPSTTATRLQWALMRAGSGSMWSPRNSPRIFCVSCSIFSSSLPMKGITLPTMSMEGTPGYPAPEMACMVVATILVMPNCLSGASPMVRTMVEQFGLVTILPLPSARLLLAGHQLEVIGIDFRHQQRHVALHAMVARIGHHHVAGLREGALDFGGDGGIHGGKEKLRRVARLALFHGEPATESGVLPARFQFMASLYFLPAERSLAPSHFRSNQGWPCKNLMKCWPTIPVAPRMPTSIRVCIIALRFVDRVLRLRSIGVWDALFEGVRHVDGPARSGTARPIGRRRPGYRW